MPESRDGFSGGGYSDDIGGSGMMNAARSSRGRGQTDYWEPYVDSARPFFTGAHSGQVHERNMGFGGAGHAADHLYDNHRHDSEYLQWPHNQLSSHDRDYHNWRTEQARNYDTSYEEWRRSRSDKFAKEFSDWRTSESPSQTSDTGQASRTSTNTGLTGSAGADMALAPTALDIAHRLHRDIAILHLDHPPRHQVAQPPGTRHRRHVKLAGSHVKRCKASTTLRTTCVCSFRWQNSVRPR